MSDEQFLQELREAVEGETFYNWVAANYYKFTQVQLKELILNLDYALYKEMGEREFDVEYRMLEETEDRLK